MVIKEIPLSLIFHDAMMIGPALRRRLIHDDALERERSHRMVSHGISQRFGSILFTYPREGEIILAVTLEGKWSFLESLRQPLYLFWFRGKFRHVWFQLSHVQTSSSPVDISLSVLIYQHTRIYAVHPLYGFPHRHKRSFRLVSNRHTYSESLLLPFRSSREIEIIFPVFLHTVRSPHRITAVLYPRYFILRNDDSMILPLRKISGRENVIICHAEPFLQFLDRTRNVMRRIKIYLPIEYASRRVCRKLAIDDWILRQGCVIRQYSQSNASHYFPNIHSFILKLLVDAAKLHIFLHIHFVSCCKNFILFFRTLIGRGKLNL